MLLSTFLAWAQSSCEGEQEFIVEGVKMGLCHHDKYDAWLTNGCFNDKKNCDALKILEEARARRFNLSAQETRGGKNQGNIVCIKLGGSIALAKLPPRGSQQSFCQGKDGSLVDSNSLLLSNPESR